MRQSMFGTFRWATLKRGTLNRLDFMSPPFGACRQWTWRAWLHWQINSVSWLLGGRVGRSMYSHVWSPLLFPSIMTSETWSEKPPRINLMVLGKYYTHLHTTYSRVMVKSKRIFSMDRKMLCGCIRKKSHVLLRVDWMFVCFCMCLFRTSGLGSLGSVLRADECIACLVAEVWSGFMVLGSSGGQSLRALHWHWRPAKRESLSIWYSQLALYKL